MSRIPGKFCLSVRLRNPGEESVRLAAHDLSCGAATRGVGRHRPQLAAGVRCRGGKAQDSPTHRAPAHQGGEPPPGRAVQAVRTAGAHPRCDRGGRAQRVRHGQEPPSRPSHRRGRHGRVATADRIQSSLGRRPTSAPSSKTCSDCGAVKGKLPLRVRVFHCEHCGLMVDRDMNATRNLAGLVASSPSCGATENEPNGNSGKTRTERAASTATGKPTRSTPRRKEVAA